VISSADLSLLTRAIAAGLDSLDCGTGFSPE
jgi:hypothetical protein